MTFQAWKVKFLNFMTFQFFHDLYEPCCNSVNSYLQTSLSLLAKKIWLDFQMLFMLWFWKVILLVYIYVKRKLIKSEASMWKKSPCKWWKCTFPKIPKYLKKRKSNHSADENIRTEYGYFILDTKKGIKGKGAHGPKSQTAGAHTSFRSMNHA